VAGPLPPVLRGRRAIGCLLTVNTQRIIAAIAGKVPILWLIATVSTALDLRLIRRAVQIIIIVADIAAKIIVKLAAARVLIVRRIVRLAELREMRLKAGVAATTEDVSILWARALNAEEEVLVNRGHFVWVLRKSCRLGKVL